MPETLTHWGWVTHICVSKLTFIGSDNGLSPGRRQAIIWTNATNIIKLNLRNKLQWNLKRNSYIFIQENAFENVVCEMAAILSRPQCVNKISLKWLHWNVFLKVPLMMKQHQFSLQVMAWRWLGNKSLPAIMLAQISMLCCLDGPQWSVNKVIQWLIYLSSI